MYNAFFESDNGQEYYFGVKGETLFDMNVGDGVSVNLSTTQGFSQIGETVKNQTVSGRSIEVKGVIYGNIQERKKIMRKTFAPFTSGKLFFEDEYFTRVFVKSPPTFSPIKNDGRFTMLLYAPFPFFYRVEETYVYIGGITPTFRFPINYAGTHTFGKKAPGKYATIINDGDVKVPFHVYIKANAACENVTITNVNTFAFLRLNCTLSGGDVVEVYRDDDNVLNAVLKSSGVVSDIISAIDEESTLFELEVGENVVSALDDNGGENLSVQIAYKPAVVALYEH